MGDVTAPGKQASGNVSASLKAATTAQADRAFPIVKGRTLLFYEEMPEQAARAFTWLERTGVKRGERALVYLDKSPVAAIRDLPWASTLIGTPILHPAF